MTFSVGNTNTNTDSIDNNQVLIGDDPSWIPDRWRSDLWPLWTIVKDVYDGLHLDRIKRRYLLQANGESIEEYAIRTKGAYLDEHFRITLEKNAGLIAQFNVEPDSPEDLLDPEYTKNVDAQGNSLQAFAQKSLARIFRDEFCLLGISLPDSENRNSERRPFFTLTDARDIRAPLVQYVDENGIPSRSGKLALTQISIRRWIQVPKGSFSYEWRQEFWVYRLRDTGCTVQIYEATSHRDLDAESGLNRDELIDSDTSFPVTEERLITDAANRPVRQIPFFWFHLDKDASVGNPGTPPLLYLAETLIMWFNKESQLDAAERRCNLPTPVMSHPGEVPDNPPNVRLGPEGFIHHAAEGKFYFAEPSGAALGSTHMRQVHREQRMQAIDERFLGAAAGGGGGLTATAVKLADRISKITMEVIAEGLETAFAELFKLYALFTDPTYTPGDPAGGIKVSRTVLEGDLQPTELAVILSWLQEQAIDRFEARAMMTLQTLQLNDDVMAVAARLREEFEESLDEQLASQPLIPGLGPLESAVSGTVLEQNETPAPNEPGSQQDIARLINRGSGDETLAESINEVFS